MTLPAAASTLATLASRYTRVHEAPVLSVDEQARIRRIAPGQREPLICWASADGRTLYAHDGISVRKVRG